MIIVSQNRKDVINFDFTQRIGLDRENNFASINIYQNGNADAECMLLGAYKTEERAKEVLKEIIEYYNKLKRDVTYAQGDGGFTFDTKFYYEMPKE